MANEEMYCGNCATETLFASVDAEDSQPDCPELMCTRCDLAIMIAPVAVWSHRAADEAWIAPQQRRAA